MSVSYARENKIPFFGICLGMQCAIIDYARNVCGLENANSTEFNSSTEFPVVDIMEDQKNINKKGATMRLGSYPCNVQENTNAFNAYGIHEINERHRHRYEVNNIYKVKLKSSGLIFSGTNKELNLVEMIEIKDHPWFVGVQFHPELKSRVVNAHPLFREFISAAVNFNTK